MLISNFDDTAKIFKNLKAPLVTSSYENSSFIIGAFDDFNVIRTMDISEYETNPELVMILSQGGWFNFGITQDKMQGAVPQELIPVINGPVIRNDKGQQLYFINVKQELNEKIRRINVLKSLYRLEYNGLIFTEGEFFDEFNLKQATDGASLLKINPHIILTMYKGLIPYLKGDIVTYDIYCGERDFLVEFTTKKKKKEPDIKTYVRYLYL